MKWQKVERDDGAEGPYQVGGLECCEVCGSDGIADTGILIHCIEDCEDELKDGRTH